MNFESVTENGVCKASADGELTIYVANDFKEKISQCVNDADSLSLDLSKVEEIDTTCLQLLMQTKQACETANKSFAITQVSPAIEDVIHLCGIQGFFDSVITAAGQ